MNNGRATPLITSVCYVRLAVSEPSASARFMSDIFGLQRVADQDGEIAFRSTEHSRDLAFWRALGAEVSDWVGDIAYLRIDGLHHRIALYPSNRNGLLYAAFEVEALDQIMQNSYFMQESQIKIVQGPGREPASRQMFLHVEGPDGMIFSYVNGMTQLDGKTRPARQFPLAATSLCDWGSESKDVPELR